MQSHFCMSALRKQALMFLLWSSLESMWCGTCMCLKVKFHGCSQACFYRQAINWLKKWSKPNTTGVVFPCVWYSWLRYMNDYCLIYCQLCFIKSILLTFWIITKTTHLKITDPTFPSLFLPKSLKLLTQEFWCFILCIYLFIFKPQPLVLLTKWHVFASAD